MRIKNLLKLLFSFMLFGISCILAIQIVVLGNTKDTILSLEEIKNLNDVDCILVLGAGIDNKNNPSLMLKERLDAGINVYNLNITDNIIMSGDHTRNNHDEVNVMKNYAMDKANIPSSNIFMDHAGISTYDSIYRAKEIFGVDKMVIVTQEYHLYRALYIAKSLGIEAYGINATKKIYAGQEMRDIREVAARCKDFFKAIFKPKSNFLGEKISLEDNADITNDYYIIIKNKSLEYTDFSKEKYDLISNIINSYNYDSEDCPEESSYIITINTDLYEIEILDNIVHIVRSNKEIVLDEEDSKLVLEILKRSR